jgi:hypothetical protein
MMVDFILFFGLHIVCLSHAIKGGLNLRTSHSLKEESPRQMTDKIYNDIPIKYTSKFYWYCSHIGELTCKGKPISGFRV